MITDLSYPEGVSVNDAIDAKLCSLFYVTVTEVADRAVQLGRASLIGKIDIHSESVYHLIPVYLCDRHWLGISWQSNIFLDAIPPFGMRSAQNFYSSSRCF